MRNKYIVSAITLALLGVTTDHNITQVNAVATKSQAQAKAKASTTLKALTKLEAGAKSESKADAKAEAEDYFSMPFEQMLAQSNANEDAIQESQQQQTFDKMPTEGIDLGGLKSKIEEAVKPVTENIDEKDKSALKEQAAAIPAAVAGETLKKPLEVVKIAGAIANSPEAHIIAKAAGG